MCNTARLATWFFFEASGGRPLGRRSLPRRLLLAVVMLVDVYKSSETAAEGLRINLECEICGQVLKTRTGLRM